MKMPRAEKWLVVAMVGQTVGTIGVVIGETGWHRVLWLALGIWCVSIAYRELHAKRRKRLARRQALLMRLDRLMRREVTHR